MQASLFHTLGCADKSPHSSMLVLCFADKQSSACHISAGGDLDIYLGSASSPAKISFFWDTCGNKTDV
jgi:hypothetical protein